MIRIIVELLPKGDESRKRHLGTAEIINDGTGTRTEGNYCVRLSKWGLPNVTWRTGTVVGFPRLQLGPWDLLMCALMTVVGGRMMRYVKKATAKKDPD